MTEQLIDSSGPRLIGQRNDWGSTDAASYKVREPLHFR
jgi:hypothetical protein